MSVVVTERKYMLTVPRASFAAYTHETCIVHSVYTHEVTPSGY